MQGFGVYLASRTEEENQLLKRKLEPLAKEFPQMRVVGLHPQGLALSAHEKMASVVINVTDWNRAEAASLTSLRAAGYRGPILVTAKGSSSESLKTLRAMKGVVFLEKPFIAKDLVGILRKMLHARAVAQRVHRRYNTDESAELTPYGKNDAYETRVVNISKGGAYLEFLTPLPLRAGDMVRMKVELKDVNRTYTVPARIVWTGRPIGSSHVGAAAGIEFVGAADVKKMMISHF